jgi:DNA-binding transcriptional LysR family regulator
MVLGELKVFLAVATERSFSRAATKLYRTQPAVSQAVRRLEDQLGQRLFDRAAKRVTLTEAGVVLLREGTRLVRLAQETEAALRRQSERGRATLRIGGSEVAAHVVLPSIAAFLHRHGHVSVEFHGLPEAQVAAEVAAGTLDIGAVALERVPAQLQQLPLSTPQTGFTVIAPRVHPLAARRSVPIGALKDERVILLTDPNLSERLTTALAESDTVPAGVMRMPGIDSLKRAVAMGLGIGVVPGGALSTPGPQGDLVAVPLAFTPSAASLTLIYGRHDSLCKVIAEFIDVVRTSNRPPLSTGDTPNARRTTAHT